jgi:hypothetical protein
MEDCQIQAETPLGAFVNQNVVTYVRIVEFILKNNSKNKEVLSKDLIVQFICKELKLYQENLSDIALGNLKKNVNSFYYKFQRENKKKCYHTDRLLNEQWCLSGLIEVDLDPKPSSEQFKHSRLERKSKKNFSEKSKRSQYLDAAKVRNSFEPEAIYLAAELNQSKAGKKDTRFVLKKINSKTGLTAAKAKEAICDSTKKTEEITPKEGLAFLLNQNLTKRQYQAIRCEFHQPLF